MRKLFFAVLLLIGFCASVQAGDNFSIVFVQENSSREFSQISYSQIQNAIFKVVVRFSSGGEKEIARVGYVGTHYSKMAYIPPPLIEYNGAMYKWYEFSLLIEDREIGFRGEIMKSWPRDGG